MRASKVLILLSLSIISIKSQVIRVETATSWNNAQTGCNNLGTDLLTAQGNQDDIDECLNGAVSGGLWIGLNNNNGWEWVAGDVTYDENSVNWANNAPRSPPQGGDCAYFITGGQNFGRIQNGNGDCDTVSKGYCCNPVTASGTSNPSSSPTPSPTDGPSAAPTDNPTVPSPSQSPTDSTSSPSSPPTASGPCPRIRREWNTMSQSDRDLYINGFLQLYNQGKIGKFTDQHADTTAEEQAHGASSFLTWHRLFLFELETQFRNLGGQYSCFSLPYWNWAEDRDEYGNAFRSWTILNSGLGGAGNANDNYCVTDGAFTENVYTPTNCPNSWQSNNGNCCLRRTTYSDGTNTGMYTSQMTADAITASDRYGRDNGGNGGARREIEFGPHGLAHCTFGICGGGHLGDGFRSPDDPIFYLLHGYVDFMYALWQDYNDYENVDPASLTRTHYNGQLTYSDIDYPLEFGVLEAEAWCNLDGNATSRDMHNIQDTTYLGYTYEYGSFFDRPTGFSTNTLNSNWFYDDPNARRRRRRLRQERETSTRKFTDLAYEQLKSQYGDNANTRNGRRELIKTLAKMECEFDTTGGYECERPAYFDDCSDMELGYNIYNNKPDVNLTLDELIEKVKDYPCMVETRKMMYSWVSQTGGIWRLCRGDFDRFCDKEFIRKRPTNGDQCEAKGYEKKSRQYSQESVVFDNNFKDDNNHNNDIINNNNDDWNFKQIFMNKDYLNRITFISVFTMVTLLMICVFCKKIISRKKGYDKVKYIEDDNDNDHDI